MLISRASISVIPTHASARFVFMSRCVMFSLNLLLVFTVFRFWNAFSHAAYASFYEFLFQAKVKALPYPPWAYIIYLFFVLIPSVCLIYPPIMDRLTRGRRGPDIMQSPSDNSSIANTNCAPPCCIGRSRSYSIDIPPVSNICVNGHVNRTVDENDWCCEIITSKYRRYYK